MKVVRYFFQILLGIIFGAASGATLLPMFAAFSPQVGGIGAALVTMTCLIFITIAPTIRRAFGRSFLFLGAAIFLLPLSTMLLSGVALGETVDAAAEHQKGVAAAAGIAAGGLLTAFAGFLGFFLGSILLLSGLILSIGGRREVIILDNKSPRREPKLSRREPKL